jgi:hypothetical protein
MPFTVHLTIFSITLFLERFKWLNWYVIKKTYLGTCGKNFISLFTMLLEIHSVEDRGFD